MRRGERAVKSRSEWVAPILDAVNKVASRFHRSLSGPLHLRGHVTQPTGGISDAAYYRLTLQAGIPFKMHHQTRTTTLLNPLPRSCSRPRVALLTTRGTPKASSEELWGQIWNSAHAASCGIKPHTRLGGAKGIANEEGHAVPMALEYQSNNNSGLLWGNNANVRHHIWSPRRHLHARLRMFMLVARWAITSGEKCQTVRNLPARY